MNEQDFIGKKASFIFHDYDGSEINRVGIIIGFEDYIIESGSYLVKIICSDGNEYLEPLDSLILIEETE
ncbi:MAG: hypothetical protein M1292_05770 [Bacteroidetes bacterium]|nr:hypothetical protein [Bacteroidota bacterium]